MQHFTAIDLIALAWFVCIWVGFTILVDRTPIGQRSLAKLMDQRRIDWVRQCAERDNRIMDTQIMNGLQQGSAFFASTSLIAIGGALTIFQNIETTAMLFENLPIAYDSSPVLWEMKALGLSGMFAYCFFKFGWSYRLFNYASILLGAIPPAEAVKNRATEAAVGRAANMLTIAGQHFNAGQRGLFLSIGYLGWFVSPWILIAASTFVFLILYRRQFHSRARRACLAEAIHDKRIKLNVPMSEE